MAGQIENDALTPERLALLRRWTTEHRTRHAAVELLAEVDRLTERCAALEAEVRKAHRPDFQYVTKEDDGRAWLGYWRCTQDCQTFEARDERMAMDVNYREQVPDYFAAHVEAILARTRGEAYDTEPDDSLKSTVMLDNYYGEERQP